MGLGEVIEEGGVSMERIEKGVRDMLGVKLLRGVLERG